MSKRIAILTGGGDCPGLNSAIRAVTRIARNRYQCEIVGIRDGFEGLIERRLMPLHVDDVRGILRVGGTILGSSNRTNPFAWQQHPDSPPIDASDRVLETIVTEGIDALIVVGGDGTLTLAGRLARLGVPVVGIPKTIDNDVHGTDYAIGFDTCVAIVTEALDRLHTTAESHHRIMLVEVMGRTAGWIALYAGIAGGADFILTPERPYHLDGIFETVERRRAAGKHFTIGVVAEGVVSPSGALVHRSLDGIEHSWKLGGVCNELAAAMEARTTQEVRSITLGHLQRGGSPGSFDRTLATALAHRAMQAAFAGESGVMAGIRGAETSIVPLAKVAVGPRLVPDSHPLLAAAHEMGVYVGK